MKALRSLEKTIDDPTPSWSAVPFLRLVAEKRYPSGFVISYVFSYHINFFDYGDAALLLHCKTQQTTFKRIAQRKHLGPTELERVKEKQRRKQTQAIAAIAATGLSITAPHGTVALVVLWMSLVSQPHFLISGTDVSRYVYENTKFAFHDSGRTCCGFHRLPCQWNISKRASHVVQELNLFTKSCCRRSSKNSDGSSN